MINSIEIAWKILLKKCITEGCEHTKDDRDKLIEIIDNHIFIPNVITSIMNAEVNTEVFINLIKNGVFNINDYPLSDEALADYVTALDDKSQILNKNGDGSDKFVYTYPERLYNIHQVTRKDKIVYENQVDTIINRLKEYDGSNRAVATLYDCALDKNEQHIPCLNWLQCLIRDNELSLHIMFRSNDLYGAFPSNMLFLNYLGLKILENLKKEYPLLKFKGIYYNSTSLHIYEHDVKEVEKIINGE